MSFQPYGEYSGSGDERVGAVPSHWTVTTLKRAAVLNYGEALAADSRNELGSIPVYGSNGIVGMHDLANTTAPTIFIGRKGSCGALTWSDRSGFAIDTVYFVDRRGSSCQLRWLYWLLHTLGLETMSQDTGVPGLGRDAAYGAVIAQPPLNEQRAIADFLDRETRKIDALVEEQQRLIDLLKEKRQSVISHAVTKGLDPTAPMKDSGVETLGLVPAHWEICRLRHVATVQTGLAKGKDVSAAPKTVELPYLRVANVQSGYLDLDDIATIMIAEDDIARYLLRPGDVLMNEGGDFDKLGRGHVWRGEIQPCVHQNHVFAVRPHALSSDWLATLIASAHSKFFFMSRSKQSTNLASISSTNLMELPVAVPPMDEQLAISSFISAETVSIDELAACAEATSNILRERRSALISAAVTGKIDVRAEVSRSNRAAA